jgi:hypothetical protein
VQNLVAYQDGEEIFFLTISPIQKDEELTVWYCREFATRLGYPATGTVQSFWTLYLVHHCCGFRTRWEGSGFSDGSEIPELMSPDPAEILSLN